MAYKTALHRADFFTCITTHSVTTDLTTHTHSPKILEGSATKRVGASAREIHVLTAGTGTLAVTRGDGTQVTLNAMLDGAILPGAVKKILPASDFTSILVLW